MEGKKVNIETIMDKEKPIEERVRVFRAYFQMEIASLIRASREVEPLLAADLMHALSECVKGLQVELGGYKYKKTSPKSTGFLLASKERRVLQRERKIINFILEGGPYRRLRQIMAVVDDNASEQTVTAHLYRLVEQGILKKAGKGKYLPNGDTTKTYLSMVEAELK